MKFRERIKDGSFWIVFLLIYFSQDTLLFGTNSNRTMFLLKNIVLVLLCLYVANKPRLNQYLNMKNYIIVLFGLMAMSLLSALFNADVTFKYCYEILLFVLAYNVTRVISFVKFREQFVYSIYYLSLLSVTVYFISLFAYPIIELLPSFNNVASLKFHSLLGFVNVSEIPMYGLMRNYSLFREPGVYSIFLIISLLFLFNTSTIDPKKKNRIFLVLFIAILTTLSTAGIIGIVLFLIYLLLGRYKQMGSATIFLIGMLVAGLYYLFSNEVVSSFVFNKLSGENTSADSRFGSIINNIDLWLRNTVSILFGNGYQFVENGIEAVAQDNGYVAGHNTNTFFKMLSVHGIFYFISALSLLYMSCRRLTSNHFSLYVFILFCVMLSNEDLIFNQVLYIIFFYGVTVDARYEKTSVRRVSAV